jgi:hypothetical protein
VDRTFRSWVGLAEDDVVLRNPPFPQENNRSVISESRRHVVAHCFKVMVPGSGSRAKRIVHFNVTARPTALAHRDHSTQVKMYI